MNVIAFGELLIRLSPPGHLRLAQATTLDINFGGAEANVAVSLALLGNDVSYITRVPKNDLAEVALQRLRGLGVKTDRFLWGGDRLGLYFLENGAAQRASTVTYDRAHSSFADIRPQELDWDTLLKGAEWFHFTGISPALSPAAAQATSDGVLAAKRLGIRTSCDLNFRAKLWTMAQAKQIMTPILENVDYLITNGEAAETVFELEIGEAREFGLNPKRETEIAAKMTERFKFKGVAITLRDSVSASLNRWSGIYYTGETSFRGRTYDLDIVDRVGGGDAFSAGLIHALGCGYDSQKVIEFALAAGCLKHSIFGDFNLVKLSEIEALAGGDGTGRVQR